MSKVSVLAGAILTVSLLGPMTGSAVAMARDPKTELPDDPTQTVVSETELFNSSPDELRRLLMPAFTGEIVDSSVRAMHPSFSKVITLYEPMIPISSWACRQATHLFFFRQSWDGDPLIGLMISTGPFMLTTSYDSAIYLAAHDGKCLPPSNGDRGFTSLDVDVSETLEKYQTILSSHETIVTCDKAVQDCAGLFKSIPIASLRSLYGCYNTDCIAELDFPDPSTGKSIWGWTVKLFDVDGV